MDERVTSSCPWASKQVLVAFCPLSDTSEYLVFLVCLSAPPGISIVLLRDINAHMGMDSETGRNRLTDPDLKLSGVRLCSLDKSQFVPNKHCVQKAFTSAGDTQTNLVAGQ